MENTRRIYSEGQVPLLRSLPSSFFTNQRSPLSARQLVELNASILQYLKPILQGDPAVYEAVEAQLSEHSKKSTNNADSKYSSLLSTEIPDNYLQKKWSTVIRLQRQIQELELKNGALESRNKELTEELETLLKTNSQESGQRDLSLSSKLNWIPSILNATLKYHSSPITAIAIHPFNPYLVTASQDGMLVFWNMLDLSQPQNQIKSAHSKSINKLIFQLDSSMLISCSSDQLIKLWDLSDLSGVKTPSKFLTGHEHIVSSLSISKQNPNILISCSRDKSIKVWDLQSGWTLHTVTAHSDWVRSVDSIGDYIISCSSDTSIRITHWPTETGIGLCLGHKQVIEDVIFLPLESNQYLDKLEVNQNQNNKPLDATEYQTLGFKYAASCGRDKLIKIWKLPLPAYNNVNGNPVASSMNPYGECIKEIRGHQSWIRKLTAHYNGRYLLSCSDDQTIKVWDLDSFQNANIEPVRTLSGHQSFVNTMTMATPIDGKLNNDNIRCYLVSGGADNSVDIWV